MFKPNEIERQAFTGNMGNRCNYCLETWIMYAVLYCINDPAFREQHGPFGQRMLTDLFKDICVDDEDNPYGY